jgi:hypothetical protein
MDEMNQPPERDANGRFVPGQSGNPSGKKPGTRNRATVLREALRDGEDESVARVIIDKALAGNSAMARFVIGLLMPRPRDRAIEIDLPECGSAEDVLAASSATIAAMARGEITPDEALTVTRLLEFRLRAITAARPERELSRSQRKDPSPTRSKEPSPASSRRGFATPDATARTAGPRESGRGGMGPMRGRDFTANLLHSTCISRPSRWLDRWAA